MGDDRPLSQLGEKGDKANVLQKAVVPALPPVSVDYIGNLLKGVKADAKGKKKPEQRNIGAESPVDVLNKKVRIFKIKQETDIEKKGCPKDSPFFAAVAGFAHHGYKAVVY